MSGSSRLARHIVASSESRAELIRKEAKLDEDMADYRISLGSTAAQLNRGYITICTGDSMADPHKNIYAFTRNGFALRTLQELGVWGNKDAPTLMNRLSAYGYKLDGSMAFNDLTSPFKLSPKESREPWGLHTFLTIGTMVLQVPRSELLANVEMM
eukprot:TRINITY_DN106128_c0_g1_i1.p1 TRINITY_DN106128_c0_g1~~TRINITY_DN106128_c0_g1_i1.p1  ORF type:complete len:156 (-),score=18.48 TRINITY_DN106128_c0_g1_i1:7-474(-)